MIEHRVTFFKIPNEITNIYPGHQLDHANEETDCLGEQATCLACNLELASKASP